MNLITTMRIGRWRRKRGQLEAEHNHVLERTFKAVITSGSARTESYSSDLARAGILAAQRDEAAFRATRLADPAWRRATSAMWLLALGGVLLLAVGVLSVAALLDSQVHHGHLTPGDAPAIVGAIVGIGGALGTLIGATITAFAKLIQARGEAESNITKAQAELIRAKAEMVRARKGLPGPAREQPAGSAEEAGREAD